MKKYSTYYAVTVLVVLTLLLQACATEVSQTPVFSSRERLYRPRSNTSARPNQYENDQAEQANLLNRIRENFALPDYSEHIAVKMQIAWYQRHPAVFQRTISRASPYLYYIFQQAKRQNLPSELVLLPVIESAYNPFARSHAGASGLWQIMPGTAKNFRIPRNFWFDGRRDMQHSTQAAFTYLSYLYQFFNHDWLLAIAAYNSGEGKVWNTIEYNLHRGYKASFWDLPVPTETQTYVPRLLAVVAIIRNPGRYGITLPVVANRPYVGRVSVKQSMRLSNMAKLAGMNNNEFRSLNAGYNRWAFSTHGPSSIYVPLNRISLFQRNLAVAMTRSPRNTAAAMSRQKHVVRAGETLARIARMNRVSIASLQSANHLRTPHLKPGQVIIIPKGSVRLAKKHRHKRKFA